MLYPASQAVSAWNLSPESKDDAKVFSDKMQWN
jgi:hypothetical protein